MQRITSITEFRSRTGAEAPTEAEEALITNALAGTICLLGSNVPATPNPGERPPTTIEIRAELLRFLILGGGPDCPVATEGVRLVGACITGPLQLDFTEAKGETDLRACRFTH